MPTVLSTIAIAITTLTTTVFAQYSQVWPGAVINSSQGFTIHVHQRVGDGNYGAVFSGTVVDQNRDTTASPRTHNQSVALKRYKQKSLHNALTEYHMLLHVQTAVGQHPLYHKHITTVPTQYQLDMDRENSIVMNRIYGIELDRFYIDKLFKQPAYRAITVEKHVCSLLTQIGGLLAELNTNHKIYHRDVKIENVMLNVAQFEATGDFELVLIDWGLGMKVTDAFWQHPPKLEGWDHTGVHYAGTKEIDAEPLDTLRAAEPYFNAMDMVDIIKHSFRVYKAVSGTQKYLSSDWSFASKKLRRRKRGRKERESVGLDFNTKYEWWLSLWTPIPWGNYPHYQCYAKYSDWSMFMRSVHAICT